jgi:hypothetical protein
MLTAGNKRIASGHASPTSFQPTLASMGMLTMESFSTRARAWTLVISLCIVAFLHMFRRRRHALPFPPGPKALPILGNALDMPGRNPWLTYWQWGKKYGMYSPCLIGSVHYILGTIDSDIVHVNSLGIHVVVLNSAKAVHELFEKRSSVYSDRYDVCSTDLMGRCLSWVTSYKAPTAFPDTTVSTQPVCCSERLKISGAFM